MAPKVSFVWDSQRQAEYICFLAKHIQTGAYQKAGLTVLAYPTPGNPHTVYFPNLNYSPQFWKAINNAGHTDLGKPFPDKAISEILPQLKNFYFKVKLVDDWDKLSDKFFNECQKFFGNHPVGEVSILITPFGTRGSFLPTKPNGKYKIYLTSRTDFPADNIARTILLAYYKLCLRQAVQTGELTWDDRMAVVDFLTRFGPFAKYFNHLKFPAVTPKQIADSQTYLAKLGFSNTVTMKANFGLELSPNQARFWNHLSGHPSQLVSYDEAATAIWGDQSDDKFSLYTLAKIVEQIRKQLRTSGVNQNILQTIRKQGYVLKI